VAALLWGKGVATNLTSFKKNHCREWCSHGQGGGNKLDIILKKSLPPLETAQNFVLPP